jgi:hypothetical protein
MSSVYLETSAIGYLASRPGSDIVFAANQLLTLEWWDGHRGRFDLFVSQATIDECSAGDPMAAAERLVFLEGIPVLAINFDTQSLARELMRGSVYRRRLPSMRFVSRSPPRAGSTICSPGTVSISPTPRSVIK